MHNKDTCGEDENLSKCIKFHEDAQGLWLGWSMGGFLWTLLWVLIMFWEGLRFLLGEWNPIKRTLKILIHSFLLILCASEFNEFLCMNILSSMNEQLNSIDDETFVLNELFNLAYDHSNYIWVLWKQ
jgi:hypothetical protein